HHATMARALGEQLELSVEVLDALAASYERWDGRGWPGRLAGEQVPAAAGIAQAAEYVEVANRVGGVQTAKRLARKRRGKQFAPAVSDVIVSEGELILAGL